MIAIENFDLIEAMNRHSRRLTLWEDSGMILNFDTLATELLGDPKSTYCSFWDYYNDAEASDLFDKIAATGLMAYYARPKENFSQIQGLRELKKDLASFIIMEDMS